jgi:hypothetical protein
MVGFTNYPFVGKPSGSERHFVISSIFAGMRQKQ